MTGVASIAGVLLGALIVIGLLAFGGDGTGEDGGQATDATVEASELTTPPTLGPLEVLPIPGDSEGPSSAPDGPVLTLPQYIEDSQGADIPDNLQLKAITGLVDDVARRSTIEYRSTSDSGLSITISRDPTSDRFELILTPLDVEGSSPTTSIVDVGSGYVYTAGSAFPAGSGNRWATRATVACRWTGCRTSSAGHAPRSAPLGHVLNGDFDRIRPDGAPSSHGCGDPQVDVAIPAAAVPEWARFEFGNNPGFRIDPDEVLDYEVFVDETGSIVLAQGANSFDGRSSPSSIRPSCSTPRSRSVLPSDDQVTDFEDYLRAIDSSSPEALRPVYADTPDDNLGDVDVSVALANLAADPPVRSVVTDRTPNTTFTITTEFDAATNRTATTYQLSNPGDLTVGRSRTSEPTASCVRIGTTSGG